MFASSSPVPSRGDRPGTARKAQRVCYALLGFVLVSVVVVRYGRPLVLNGEIGLEPARVGQVERRIDPNTASWAELARLPDLGEVLAKRIVAYRDERRAAVGASETGVAVFSSLEDLRAIRGIGPGTLEAIADYLKWPGAGQGRDD